MDSSEVIAVSLCSGYEGIGLGLRRVFPNLRVVAYSEIDEYACAVLAQRMEEGRLDAAPIWTDLRTFPGAAFHRKVDIIFCGYPCQPFSFAGQRQGEADPRHLWPHIAAIVRAVEPVLCFFENVPGHLTLGFPGVYRSLRGMGFAVEAGLFTAAEVGAPHLRKRLFVLAHRECARRRQIEQYDELPARRRQASGGSGGPGRNVPDSEQPGLQGVRSEVEEWRGLPPAFRRDTPTDAWPAGPGQSQYEWEAPRTVERGLGRKSHGASHRVDRLRLLGNGVVPAQAELAFRTLYGRMMRHQKQTERQ